MSGHSGQPMVFVLITTNVQKEYTFYMELTTVSYPSINQILESEYVVNTKLIAYCHPPAANRITNSELNFKERFMTDSDVWSSLTNSKDVSVPAYLEFYVKVFTSVDDSRGLCEHTVRTDGCWKLLDFGVDLHQHGAFLSWAVNDDKVSGPYAFSLKTNGRIADAIQGH